MAVTPRSRLRQGTAVALLALLGSVMSAVPAAAHSELVSSTPAAGSTVMPAPGFRVVLSFSEALKSGSKADIVGPDGATAGTAVVDPTDDTKVSWTPSGPLMAGAWTIRWTSIATDGDVVRGTIPFSVAAATPEPSVPTAIPVTPSPTPVASPAPGDVTAAGAGAILPVIAALLVIALLALVLLRNRRATPRP